MSKQTKKTKINELIPIEQCSELFASSQRNQTDLIYIERQ